MDLLKPWRRGVTPTAAASTELTDTANDPLARAQKAACFPPLASAPSDQAREAHKHNPHAIWATRSVESTKGDASLASNRIWDSRPVLGIRPKFRVSQSEPVFAMGSCFAREIEDALFALGFQVPSRCDSLFDDPRLSRGSVADAGGARPRAYLNRYNSMSMLDEFRHLLGLAPEIEQGLLTYALDKGAAAELHYTQSLPQVNAANTLERRRLVREHLGPKLRGARLFVLTLGLAEAWFDKKAERFLNNTPGPRVLAAHGKQLEVRLTTFLQHQLALEALYSMLCGVFGSDAFKVIVTVSPVPLERTFLDQDVVVTNSYSKAMLRTVAQTFASDHANVDYFPSYELVSYADPKTSWAWDYRHVNPGLVAHIMKLFQQHYVTDANSFSE